LPSKPLSSDGKDAAITKAITKQDIVMSQPAKKLKSLRCPTCGQIVTTKDTDFPFCSDRCKTIDLGKWASGVYRIASPVLDPDLLEEIEGMRPRSSGDE
jgi:endogenous inhibitor of DNA gyrase (YacG/DUF329 family)